MLNGLDLFSGYGGLTLALSPWVWPIAYCEIERYPQGILLSRMADGNIPTAPIWDDIKTFNGRPWKGRVDIIYGGFPCQDLSVAGSGKGLAGERSGLFFEIMRLSKEIRPSFIFLENVIGIRKRGLHTVGRELAYLGYDCRWYSLSAAEVGANHKRDRWFCLAHANGAKLWKQSRGSSRTSGKSEIKFGINGASKQIPHSYSKGQCGQTDAAQEKDIKREREKDRWTKAAAFERDWWKIEPDFCRVVNGCPFRVDQIKALGNGVVPLQARTAFKKLMGIK